MKKLLVLLFTVLMSIGVSAQEVKIDSINIYAPGIQGKLKTITKKQNLEKTLDSLNRIYKTDKFNVYYYLSDDVVYRCRFRKPKPITMQSI